MDVVFLPEVSTGARKSRNHAAVPAIQCRDVERTMSLTEPMAAVATEWATNEVNPA